MRDKKKSQRTTRVVPTTPLFVHLDERGKLEWDHEGLRISRLADMGVPPNCVLLDIREYNRLKGKVTK